MGPQTEFGYRRLFATRQRDPEERKVRNGRAVTTSNGLLANQTVKLRNQNNARFVTQIFHQHLRRMGRGDFPESMGTSRKSISPTVLVCTIRNGTRLGLEASGMVSATPRWG